jgi:hypothetical protein
VSANEQFKEVRPGNETVFQVVTRSLRGSGGKPFGSSHFKVRANDWDAIRAGVLVSLTYINRLSRLSSTIRPLVWAHLTLTKYPQ